jgi:hypothetical protein
MKPAQLISSLLVVMSLSGATAVQADTQCHPAGKLPTCVVHHPHKRPCHCTHLKKRATAVNRPGQRYRTAARVETRSLPAPLLPAQPPVLPAYPVAAAPVAAYNFYGPTNNFFGPTQNYFAPVYPAYAEPAPMPPGRSGARDCRMDPWCGYDHNSGLENGY